MYTNQMLVLKTVLRVVSVVQVIPGIPPIDLVVEEQLTAFNFETKTVKTQVRNVTLKLWLRQWNNLDSVAV